MLSRRVEFIKRLVADISASNNIVAVTGTGLLKEDKISGLREKYGLRNFTYSKFMVNPSIVWETILRMRKDLNRVVRGLKPNQSHYALMKLAEVGKLKCIITEDVSGVHQKSGSLNVVEVYGNINFARCWRCNKYVCIMEALKKVEEKENPPLCECGSILQPEGFFIDAPVTLKVLEKIQEEVLACDLLIIAGSHLTGSAVENIPIIAKRKNLIPPDKWEYGVGDIGVTSEIFGSVHKKSTKIVEINVKPSPSISFFADYVLRKDPKKVLPKIVKEMGVKK